MEHGGHTGKQLGFRESNSDIDKQTDIWEYGSYRIMGF